MRTSLRSRSAASWLRLAIGLLVTTLVSTACGAAGGSSSSGGDHKLRLVYTTTAATLPAWVAHDEGFFKENGIEVGLNVTTDLSSIIPALGRQYDLGVGIQPVIIKAASKGIDVVEVSGNEIVTKKTPTIVVLAKPGSGIRTPKDLEGKRLGAPTIAGNINYATMYWLKQQGVDLDKVRFVQVNTPNMPDQLKAGNIDAAELQEPYATVLRKQGYGYVGYPLAAVGDPCHMASWIAKGNWARDHLDEIARFKKALAKADTWIEQHPDKARAVLAKYTGQPPEIVKQSPLTEYTTETTPESLQQWDKVLRSVGDFKGHVDYSKLIVTSG